MKFKKLNVRQVRQIEIINNYYFRGERDSFDYLYLNYKDINIIQENELRKTINDKLFKGVVSRTKLKTFKIEDYLEIAKDYKSLKEHDYIKGIGFIKLNKTTKLYLGYEPELSLVKDSSSVGNSSLTKTTEKQKD